MPGVVWYSDQEYFQYQPWLLCPGETTYHLLETQIANGYLAQLVFYGFHFRWNPQPGQWELTQSGWQNIHRLARILPQTAGAIVVVPTGDAEADAHRVRMVQDAFAGLGFDPVPEIVLGNPGYGGLNGVEAARIWEQRQAGSPYFRQAASSLNLNRTSGAGAVPDSPPPGR